MKDGNRFSWLDRLVGGGSAHPVGVPGETGPLPTASMLGSRLGGATGMTVPELEKAYRDLLLEYQVLAESNDRLHQRLAHREHGLEDSPGSRELMRAQRNALVERSHRLRELDYETKNLQRQNKKLSEANRGLSAELDRREHDAQAMLQREAGYRRELEQVRAELQRKKHELTQLAESYTRLEARLKQHQTPHNSAANGHF